MALFDPYIFQMKKYKSQEKDFFRHLIEKKQISGIHELFANTSHLTNIIPIPIRKFWNSKTIPIPICWLRESIPIPIRGKNHYWLITGV